MTTEVSEFGVLLRQWRDRHGMSQLELSTASDVSSRHISFIETGRSRPSREMVLRLAETLTVPLRDRNSLLLAAGHAPAYRESPLGDADLAPVRRALELVLRSHEPYPAFVLDRGWNILLANDAHHRMLQLMKPELVGAEGRVNVMRLVLDPDGLRPRIANWPVVAHVLGHRLRQQLRAPGLGPRERRDLEDLLSLPGVAEAMTAERPPPEAAVVIPLQLVVKGQTLSWFSTLATIGTPLDVTLDELMIESLFPSDDATAYLAREVAADGPPVYRGR